MAKREFVEWVVRNETVATILDWSKDTYSPDEMIWASLFRFPGAPGGRNPAERWDLNELQTVTRIVKWAAFEEGSHDPPVYPKCHGFYKRGLCVFGLGDVAWVCYIPYKTNESRISI